MTLALLQRRFVGSLLDGGEPPVADARGWRVHLGNYRGGLVEALRDTFERTERLLGHERFAAMAHAYAEGHPSHAWSLNGYGATFPDFLQRLATVPQAVAEVAWIDEALRDAFYGPDVPSIALRDCPVDDWSEATFRFVPSVRLHRLHTNAATIWAALAASSPVPDAVTLTEPSTVRVWRRHLAPRFATLPSRDAICLSLAMSGATFGEVCAWLGTRVPAIDVAAEAGTLLREWFDEGLVQGCSAAGASR
ncbi:DNA-binding domain-containing protein [Luteibacter sp. 329MFSha]|uniref:HvfC/BufC N-terminal domain-containing protein n=1 Tax=Luteibacter sp. 329MFSha TaxID=1798239 RepID=UPI0008C7CF6E|nr:DNA-binding domain-containing protein [Luteibacter sp. 329MFSha]SEW21386.1 Putative DNA-binding domain-containing protein [Luteibacter sp. 329MFSha]